jgi:hypothetical protein
MLILAAFALLVVGLVLLFLLSPRRVREFWPGATAIVGAATLFALHAHTQNGEARRLDSAIATECGFLAVSLNADVEKYRGLIAASFAGPTSAVSQFEDEYRGAFDAREQLIRLCTPTPPAWNPWDCLPATLTRESMSRIEHAAAAIRNRTRCDTR